MTTLSKLFSLKAFGYRHEIIILESMLPVILDLFGLWDNSVISGIPCMCMDVLVKGTRIGIAEAENHSL